MTEALFAVYSRFEGHPTRVHYSHLSEAQADAEVDRMNNHCLDAGVPAGYWSEPHHPECVFVIG
jgi:hypothetical protein